MIVPGYETACGGCRDADRVHTFARGCRIYVYAEHVGRQLLAHVQAVAA